MRPPRRGAGNGVAYAQGAAGLPGPATVQVTSKPELVFDWATQRCSDNERPDLPVRAFRGADGQVQMTISSPVDYRLIGPDLSSLKPDCTPVLISANDRDPAHYDFWNWLAATYTPDGKTIYAVVHEEYHGDQAGSRWQAARDFGPTQGAGGWRYQGFDGRRYTAMRYDAGKQRWQGARPLCQIGTTWMHPGMGCEPSRTWISPVDGSVTVSGRVYDMAPQGGNGVSAAIYLNSKRLWSATIANGDSRGKAYDLHVQVRKGDALHFRVDARGNTDFDTTHFDPGINVGPAPCPSGNHALCTLISLTFAVSTDGGRSYTLPPAPRHLVAAPAHRYDPGAMRALWQPSNIVKSPSDGAYYMLVQRDVHDPATGTDVQGMCVLRTATPGDPTSWRAWDGSGFNMRFVDPYRGATIEPAAHTCRLVSPGQVGALTYSLTYNTYLGAFLALGVRGDGFYYALSNDLIHWTQPQRVMAAVQGFANGGQTPYYAYPSIVDPDSQSRNFDTSGRTPYLYYTRVNSLDPLNFDLLRVRVAFER
ncbi:MAG: hypothetical protein P8Z81_00570 [Deinococcales bacterium]